MAAFCSRQATTVRCVIDELGYLSMDATSAHWVFQVVSARYERGSIILTSNRGFADWGSVFADQVVAGAILDQLLHHSSVVNIKGASYRRPGQPDARSDQTDESQMPTAPRRFYRPRASSVSFLVPPASAAALARL
jgi:hypothetical protein